MVGKKNRAYRVLAKIFLGLAILVVVFFLTLWAILKVPAVQNFLVDKATTYVSSKTNTRVELAYIDLEFPKSIVLEGIFLDDKNQDTLLSVGKLKIDISMLALLNKKILVQELILEDAYGRLMRSPNDSIYNFQFLIDAFSKDSPEKEVVDTTSSNWDIQADHIIFRNIRFVMDDAYGGMNLYSALSDASIEVHKLDLANQSIEIGDVRLTGGAASIQQTKLIEDTSTSNEGGWDKVSLESIQVSDLLFKYDDPFACMNIFAKVDAFELDKANVSLKSQTIKVSELALENSISSIQLEKDTSSINLSESKDKEIGSKEWEIVLDKLLLDNNSFKLDFLNMPTMANGVDWNHLNLKGIRTDIRYVVYKGLVIQADVKELSVQERSGLGIRSLVGKFEMDEKHIELKNFALQTNYSSIGQQVQLKYASMEEMLSTMQIQCSLVDNYIAVQDLLILQPQLQKQEILHRNANRLVHFTLKASGSTQSLGINKFVLAAEKSWLNVTGTIRNVTDPDKLFFDLDINNITTGRLDIQNFLPDSVLPESIQLPDSIYISGNYIGSLSDFSSQLKGNTSFGNFSVNASIENLQRESLRYRMALATVDFHLGHLLKQKTLGKLTCDVNVNGLGDKFESMHAGIQADVKEVAINNYKYENISLAGKLDTGFVNLNGIVNDSNLHAVLIAKANLNRNQEFYDVKLDLKGIDFKGLNLTDDQIQMSAHAEVLFKGNSSKNLNGHLAVRNILLMKNTKEYKIDSLVFASLNEPSRNEATLNSSMLAVSFKGNLDLLSVVPALEKHIDRYFDSSPKAIEEATSSQNFTFDLRVNDSPVLREVIFPQLISYESIDVKGGFNSDSSQLWMNIDLPELRYSNIDLQQFDVRLRSDKTKMNYSTGWKIFKMGDWTVQRTTLSGDVANDTVSINLDIKDSNEKDKLILRSLLSKHNTSYYRYKIAENGLQLQGNAWAVDPLNYIEFGKNHLYVNHMKWSFQDQLISAQSQSQQSALNIQFKKFDLHTLAQIAEQSDSLIMGTLNGDISIKDIYQKTAFTSDLKINNLAYKQSKIGDLDLQADNLTTDRYSIKAMLSGMGNKVSVIGYFAPKVKNALNFSVAIDALQLSSIEAFTAGQIVESKGVVRGKIQVEGAVSEPIMRGKLNFVNVGTRITYLNEYVTLENEAILLKPQKVTFNAFKLKDSQGNIATIDGDVLLESFTEPTFDLKVNTNDFMVLNTTEVNNKLYYGRIYLDSKINIKGTPQLPVITADLKVEKGSRFSFAVPESQVSTDRGDGIVVFIKDTSYFDRIMLRQQNDIPAEQIKGISLKAKVTVDKDASFTLLVDPYSGDSLHVNGRADLLFTLDPNGAMGLTGRYVISEGSYKATLEGFVAKEFEIVEGSKIEWYGDVMDARVDVTARYDTRVKPTALMSIGSRLTPAEAASYSQPLPFYIFMMMKGDLLQPQISFKLDMPENQKGAGGGAVYGKLSTINADEAELNKQVFSLLVFNNFMASSNGATGADASDFARSSVSRLMSDQLNKLSAQYIKGVEVDVDLVSYNQNDIATNHKQGNTQLQVGVKKTLLDDRLSVQVGGNVMLEGQQNTADPMTGNNAQNITGDVVLEYKFTKSGRYKLKGFRLNQLDGVTNGIVIQTGVGIVYTRDYNRTRDLFENRKRKIDKKTERKQDVQQY